MFRLSEEENVAEGYGLMLLEHRLNVRKGHRTIGIPTETQLDIFFPRFARLKDMKPGMRICGGLLFLL